MEKNVPASLYNAVGAEGMASAARATGEPPARMAGSARIMACAILEIACVKISILTAGLTELIA